MSTVAKNTVKKTSTKMKLNGVSYLHYSKCDPTNSFPKEYIVNSAGVQFFKMRDKIVADTDEVMVDQMIDLPNIDNIESIDFAELEVNEDGVLLESVITEKPKVTPSVKETIPATVDGEVKVGRMKQRFLNKITGAYVGYARMIQLKCQKRWID